jgi:hypothetical protein
MNLKEIFDKLFYKNDKKTGERRISKFKTIGLAVIGFFVIMLIIGVMNPITDLNLDESSATLTENQTTYTVKGSTEAQTVNITSEELKLNNIVVNVSNGKFEYELNISKDIKNVNVNVVAAVENKSSNDVTLTLTREEPQKEEPKPTEEKTSNEDNTYITTDILNAKNAKLDKYTFDSPDNSESDNFYVKLAKRGFVEIGFGTAGDDAYSNYEKLSKLEYTTVKKATIGGFEGYLDTEYGFVFVFKKDGKNYVIQDINGDVKWNSFIEEDISILLKEWDIKS